MGSIKNRENKNVTSHWRAVVHLRDYPTVCKHFARKLARQGASNFELVTAMGYLMLGMLQSYTHLDVQVTKKFSKNISEHIFQGVSS